MAKIRKPEHLMTPMEFDEWLERQAGNQLLRDYREAAVSDPERYWVVKPNPCAFQAPGQIVVKDSNGNQIISVLKEDGIAMLALKAIPVTRIVKVGSGSPDLGPGGEEPRPEMPSNSERPIRRRPATTTPHLGEADSRKLSR